MDEVLRRKFIEFVEDKSKDVEKRLQFQSIFYKDDNPSKENKYIFFPTKNKSDKLVIYIRGGMWINLNLSSSSFLADYFFDNGFNFAAIGFDNCPTITLFEMISQIKLAIKFIMKKHTDQNKIYLIGHSAGSHLALSVLLCDWIDESLNFSTSDIERLHGIILISGTYDLQEVVHGKINSKLNLTSEEVWKVSPIHFVKNIRNYRNDFMIWLLVESNDYVNFQLQSKNLFHELRKFVNENCLHFMIIEDVDHWSILSQLGNIDYQLSNIIIDYLNG